MNALNQYISQFMKYISIALDPFLTAHQVLVSKSIGVIIVTAASLPYALRAAALEKAPEWLTPLLCNSVLLEFGECFKIGRAHV